MEGDTEDKTGAMVGAIIQAIFNAIVMLVIWFIFASMYKPKVTDMRPAFPNPVPPELNLAGGIWKFTTFQCFEDCQYCLHGCCIPGISAGDRWQTTGVNTYWTVVICFIAADTTANITAGVLSGLKVMLDIGILPLEHCAHFIIYAVFAGWCTTQRQALRVKLGGQPGDALNDFICYWCCACCTLVQEARQVDLIQGVRVQCCCQMINTQGWGMPGGMPGQPGAMQVGQPVMIGGQIGQPIQPYGGQIAMGTVVAGTPVQGQAVNNAPKEGMEAPPMVMATPVQATVISATVVQPSVVQATVVTNETNAQQ